MTPALPLFRWIGASGPGLVTQFGIVAGRTEHWAMGLGEE